MTFDIVGAKNALREREQNRSYTERGTQTRLRTRNRDTDAAEPLAPKALAAERAWEGSESRMPEWGSVAGSPRGPGAGGIARTRDPGAAGIPSQVTVHGPGPPDSESEIRHGRLQSQPHGSSDPRIMR